MYMVVQSLCGNELKEGGGVMYWLPSLPGPSTPVNHACSPARKAARREEGADVMVRLQCC